MSGKVVIAFVAGAILLVIQPPLSAERVYQYEVTVGPGVSYDFTTINAAIVDIDNNRAAGESFGQGEREGGTPTAQS